MLYGTVGTHSGRQERDPAPRCGEAVSRRSCSTSMADFRQSLVIICKELHKDNLSQEGHIYGQFLWKRSLASQASPSSSSITKHCSTAVLQQAWSRSHAKFCRDDSNMLKPTERLSYNKKGGSSVVLFSILVDLTCRVQSKVSDTCERLFYGQ